MLWLCDIWQPLHVKEYKNSDNGNIFMSLMLSRYKFMNHYMEEMHYNWNTFYNCGNIFSDCYCKYKYNSTFIWKSKHLKNITLYQMELNIQSEKNVALRAYSFLIILLLSLTS